MKKKEIHRGMTRLIIIRHGETDWNIEGRYQGQADPPLNKKGFSQARKLASELTKTGLDVIFSSPLQRAFQTAKVIAEPLNIPVNIEPRLMEIHQGEWQTLLVTEIAARYPEVFHLWETQPWTVRIPGGESIFQVQQRVNAAVDEMVSQHRNKCIGLVCHRIPISLIKMRYQGLNPDLVRSIQLPNTYWEQIILKDG